NFPICVALSSDGASLVTGTAAGEVWLWRVADRTPLLALQGHTGQVHGLALNEDGRLLARGSADGTARLGGMASGGRGGAWAAGGQRQRGWDAAPVVPRRCT